jgi:hypothetical protein
MEVEKSALSITNDAPMAGPIGSDSDEPEPSPEPCYTTLFDNPLVSQGKSREASAASMPSPAAAQDALLLAPAIGSSLLHPRSAPEPVTSTQLHQECVPAPGPGSDQSSQAHVNLGHRRTVSYDREAPSMSPSSGRSPTTSSKALFLGATSIREEESPERAESLPGADSPAAAAAAAGGDPSFFVPRMVVHTITMDGAMAAVMPAAPRPAAAAAGGLSLRRTITTDGSEVDAPTTDADHRTTGHSPLSPAPAPGKASIFRDGPSSSSAAVAGKSSAAAWAAAPWGQLPSFKVRRTITTDGSEVDAPTAGPEERATGRSPLSPGGPAAASGPSFDESIEDELVSEALAEAGGAGPALLPSTSLDEALLPALHAAAVAAVLEAADAAAAGGIVLQPAATGQLSLRRTMTVEDDRMRPVLAASSSPAAGLRSAAPAGGGGQLKLRRTMTTEEGDSVLPPPPVAGAGNRRRSMLGPAAEQSLGLGLRLRRTITIEEGEPGAAAPRRARTTQGAPGLSLRRTETIEEGDGAAEEAAASILRASAGAAGTRIRRKSILAPATEAALGLGLSLRRTVTIEEGEASEAAAWAGGPMLQLRRTITIEEGEPGAAGRAAKLRSMPLAGMTLAGDSVKRSPLAAGPPVQLRRTITIEEGEMGGADAGDADMPYQPAGLAAAQLAADEEEASAKKLGAGLGAAFGQAKGKGGLAGPVMLHIRAAQTLSEMEEVLTPGQLAAQLARQMGMEREDEEEEGFGGRCMELEDLEGGGGWPVWCCACGRSVQRGSWRWLPDTA